MCFSRATNDICRQTYLYKKQCHYQEGAERLIWQLSALKSDDERSDKVRWSEVMVSCKFYTKSSPDLPFLGFEGS